MSDFLDRQHEAGSTALRCHAPARIVPIDAALSQHLSQVYWQWNSTFDRDRNASPLQHPDFVLAELATSRVTSPLQPVVIQDGQDSDGSSIGILVPKAIRTRQVGGIGLSWELQGMRLVGGRFLTTHETFDSQMRLLTTAADHCRHIGADFLLIEDLDETTVLHRAVQCSLSHDCRVFATHDYQPRRYIDFPSTESEYWSTFSSRSLSKFRRNLKKFGKTRLERITRIEQIPDFLRTASEISQDSWQSRQFGLRIRNDDDELQQYSVLAQNGSLRSYVWWVEDRPAAFAVCNQHAGCFRYEEIAFRAEFGQFSPGRTMLQQIVEDLYRHDPPSCFDFGGGDAEYKQQFANRESRSGTVWLVPRTWRASASLSYLKLCRQVCAGMRSAVKLAGMRTRVRQWLRSGNSNDTGDATTIQNEMLATVPMTQTAGATESNRPLGNE